ncbi:MAG: hypothetical protein HDT42_08025 [Ruminococcaceae bacterium]|nr:hypothetical protein [Oscillospiraceae bacterium]
MNAIYTVIENGRESYFRTGIAGGYSYPFLAYGYAKSMARTLNGVIRWEKSAFPK